MKSLLVAASLLVWGGVNSWAIDVPEPVYFNDFSSTEGLTIVGSGEFITDGDAHFGQIYHNNPSANTDRRSNYLLLPENVLTHSGTTQEMTIGFWVNRKADNDYYYCPLFSAYKTTSPATDNGSPMFICQSRGILQVNDGGGKWSDFTDANNDKSSNTQSTVWLDDNEWHYYTVTLTATKAAVYVDGKVINSWTMDGNTDGQVISGLFSAGAEGNFPKVCLGGNQAWGWNDKDASFGFDDFAVYDVALSPIQIAAIMQSKYGNTLHVATLNHTASSYCENNKDVYTSNIDAEREHVNNSGFNSTWQGAAYADFSFTLPDGHSLTSATLSFTVLGESRAARDTKLSYANAGETLDYTALEAGNAKANLASTSITTISFPQGTEATFNQDVTAALRAMVAADKNNIIFKWTGNSGGGDVYGKGHATNYPILTYITTAESTFDVSFRETNSVDAQITINDIDVTAGTTLTAGTYNFTATATGYNDYAGSFTVSDDNIVVEFTMTAKTVYNYSVNAIDEDGGVIKENIVSGTCYADESTSFFLPRCVLVEKTLYFMPAEVSYKSENVTSNNQVFSYPYTTSTIENVVFFVEGENITGAAISTATNNQKLASNGYMGRGSNLNVTTLDAGSYTIYLHYINTNSGTHSALVKAGENEVINNSSISGRTTVNGAITLTESTTITLTAAGSSTSGVDYLYIVKTGVTATIGETGWTTFASPYALDLSTLEGATAYYASAVGGSSVTMTSTSQANVAASEGIMLKGEPNATISIPAVATGERIEGNKLMGCPTATEVTTPNENYYVLVSNGGTAEFQNLNGSYTENKVTIPAGKAYLDATGASAHALTIVFDDDVDGIETMRGEENEKMRSEVYDLSGRRVQEPARGLYIKGGKKFFVK